MPPLPGYSKLDPKLLMEWVTWGAAQLAHLGENLLLFLIILMFMVFEAARFPAKLEKAFGGSPITNDHFRKIVDDIRRYIVFKGMSNLLSCVVVTRFYFAIGVDYALLWGLIAFFFYFIPNIGAIISAIPPLLLIFVEQNIGGAVTLVVGLVIIESIIGYGIEPRLLGHGLGISTVVVFLSLIFWGWLLGPIGLILAAPLTIVTKIVLQAFEETRWVAVLLDEKVPAQ
jgi:AI-2 transport protein TqsA